MRIESLEVTEQIMATKKTANNRKGKIKYSVSDAVVTEEGVVKLNVAEVPKDSEEVDQESEEEEVEDMEEEMSDKNDEENLEGRVGLSMPLTEDDPEESPPKKSIHDFTVMKRYLNCITEKFPEKPDKKPDAEEWESPYWGQKW